MLTIGCDDHIKNVTIEQEIIDDQVFNVII